ncbi:protein involved in gliding motility GldG [Muriicola jejuensis]|uniref:Gliding motility-associated ABC transporter substrate-binding protein GldG n=1 Tax=Muriicola jejuensis TaxID=504488 RepID=A0A6P0UFU9_9FLAO|nr:gliding motility-associated ABC transporter substrate-binding protein GldG [Muriicola jejuensis]NER11502.1 gliding motility-associated ABC transporter substrate-binding protein GldG [Muriicola jejuensis]SMP20291.1 protein involved in gliding motility GldG [Muriicola jejuensis]
MKKSDFKHIALGIGILVAINLLSGLFYHRFDLTEDKRFTLSKATENILENLDSPVIIDVLLEGDLPSEFQRLKLETEQLLENLYDHSNRIKFGFEDPLEDRAQAEATIAQLQRIGLTPASVTTEEEGRVSQELVFPWAMVTYKDQTVRVPLLKNKLGASTEDRINNSIQNLEYAFSDALSKLAVTDRKKVAVIKGNGELEDLYLADFLTTLREYYNIGAITLDSVPGNPQSVLDQLSSYDLALIAKPTQPFSEAEKYVLDQFMVSGGRSLWLVDPVAMELDSLFNEEGSAMALPRDLNLMDFFFKYGIRLNRDLVDDLYCAQIVLASGDGNASEYNPLPWVYYPMVFSQNNHPINANIEALRFQFSSTIDTLENTNKKTILARSSPLSKKVSVPRTISFDILNTAPDRESYTEGEYPMAVLVEGVFTSAYKNRIKPLELKGAKEEGPDNKMIVISDGDLAANQLRNGRPLELGYDKWTNNFFGNKEFLVNCVNYLLDDTGLINIRNRKVVVPMLDPEKISEQKSRWKLINMGVPLLFVLGITTLFLWRRKVRFGQ